MPFEREKLCHKQDHNSVYVRSLNSFYFWNDSAWSISNFAPQSDNFRFPTVEDAAYPLSAVAFLTRTLTAPVSEIVL